MFITLIRKEWYKTFEILILSKNGLRIAHGRLDKKLQKKNLKFYVLQHSVLPGGIPLDPQSLNQFDHIFFENIFIEKAIEISKINVKGWSILSLKLLYIIFPKLSEENFLKTIILQKKIF